MTTTPSLFTQVYAQRLLAEIESSKTGWRLGREYQYRSDIELYVALRESITRKLAPYWWWQDNPESKMYLVDPLAERIPQVWSDLLFGEEPVFEASTKKDQEKFEDYSKINQLPSQLKWAEEMCSSEGEVWWRHVSVPALGHCITEWHSRLNVIPLWVGRKLVAAAFVSILEPSTEEHDNEVIYIEVHAEGAIYNRLYEARPGTTLKGKGRSLDSHDGTKDLLPYWEHDLPILCGRIPNRIGRDWRVGTSDYSGKTGLFFALNELLNIGQDNARLTGKQRVVIPERFLDLRGQLPKGSEVIVATEVDQDPDKIKNEFAQITWEFDASAMVAYQEFIENKILTRVRVAPQLVGKGGDGTPTGPGWRARLVDTLMAAEGKAAFWDDILPDQCLQTAFMVENLPGLDKGWSTDKPPTFKRNDSLPDDPEAISRTSVMEVNANVLSRETAIAKNNPQWGPERVKEELTKIRDEKDLMLKATAAPDGNQRIPDPGGSIPREPGREDPSAVPDPRSKTSG